ncbi:MAG: gliding motility-associated C-terminal domain-containing protein, partial [Bacteroidetes bacterium]
EKPDFVHIQGNEAPVPIDIHWVSVESDSEIKLMYKGYSGIDFAAYHIYRETPTGSGNWQAISRTEFVDDTLFIDQNLNTRQNSYCYKVTVVNQCGEESLLAASPRHCSIELQATAEPDRNLLAWNNYVGWQVAAYELYRVQSYSKANVQLLATVPGFVQSYIDSSAICVNNYHYRIKAIGLEEGQVSWSDTTTAVSSQSQPVEPSEIFRVTVVDNRAIQLEWLPFDDREAEVIYIEKKSNKENSWSIAGKVSPGTLSFTDTLVDVSREAYSYRLHAVDSCGGSYPYSNVAASILLDLKPITGGSELFWTAYQGWELGVSRYEIEIFDETLGIWKILAVVQGGDTLYTDDSMALNQANMCYRIRAYEQGGNNASSLSNEVCRPVVPDLYAPNAFTPNLDNINDEFYLEGLYITEFHLRIFNQWGQLVFESRNLEEAWDGTFNGRAVPEGVYVYVARGKGFHDIPFEIAGTVSLIR